MFVGGLYLKPGVAAHLVRFEPLLRPLIQQRWAQHIAGLRANSMLDHEYELETFLFGADRISLMPVTSSLRDLQSGRCFYCGKDVGRDRHIDHFIPWSRYRDNGLENLVFTDAVCNEKKRAYLAGMKHLNQWLDRFRPVTQAARDLDSVAKLLKWERQPTRTYGAAKTAYLYSTPVTLFWADGTGLRREDPRSVRLIFAS